MDRHPPDAATITEDVLAHYDAHRATLVRCLRHTYARPHEHCEEVVQDTFVTLLQELRQGRPVPEQPFPWLLRTAHNAMRNELRDRRTADRKRPEVVAHVVARTPTSFGSHRAAEDQIRERELRGALTCALPQMTHVERQCFVLRAQGRTFQEIAELEPVSRRRASEAVERALRKVRQCLEGSRDT